VNVKVINTFYIVFGVCAGISIKRFYIVHSIEKDIESIIIQRLFDENH